MTKLDLNTESTYIDGLKNRDSNIFKEVYDLYWAKMYISAFHVLRNKEQSEDVVQEVFSYVWNNAEKLDIKNLQAWLFTSVRYQVFNVIRSGKVRDKYENLNMINEFSSNIAELKLDREDIQRSLTASLDKLPPRCKEIFMLSRFEHLSYKEIAIRLDLSEKTVENQIGIALKKLRISLGDLAFLLSLFLI